MRLLFQTLDYRVDQLGQTISELETDIRVRKERVAKELDELAQTENMFLAVIGK